MPMLVAPIAAFGTAVPQQGLLNTELAVALPPLETSRRSVVTPPEPGAPTITRIDLVTEGRVPGIDEAAFIEQAKNAKAGCPVSRALASVPEITLEASLVS